MLKCSPLGLLLREVSRCQRDLPTVLKWKQSFFFTSHRPWENNIHFWMLLDPAHIYCYNKGCCWRIVPNKNNEFSSPPLPIRTEVGCVEEDAAIIWIWGTRALCLKAMCRKTDFNGMVVTGDAATHSLFPCPGQRTSLLI